MEKNLKIATVAMLLGFSARANVIVWPSDAEYQPLYSGENPYSDIEGDADKTSLDIVGDSTYASSYMLYREAPGAPGDSEDQLFFRIRLNDFKKKSSGAYQILFETDGDNSVDWFLQLETSDLASEGILTFGEASGTNQNSTIFGPTAWTGNYADYVNWTGQPTSDGSSFGNDPDYFLDMAMSWDAFSTHTGITSTNDAFRLLIGASKKAGSIMDADIANSLGDSKEDVNFEDIYSGDVIPEAMTITLILGFGTSMLVARRIFGE